MQPMSYNLWLYVYANPVMFTDPSGMFALTPRDTHPSLDGYSRFTTDPLSIEEELNIALGCSPLYTSLLQNYYYRSPSPYRYSMSQMFGQPQGGGQSSTQNPWDTMLGWGLNGAAMLPGLETVDDALTAFTGCGIACQLGYDQKVGWGWRGAALLGLLLPISGKSARLTMESVDEIGMIGKYSDLKKITKGTGLEVHHLIEKRFLNLFSENPRQWESVILDSATHQEFTNQWRKYIGYSKDKKILNTNTTNMEDIEVAVREIYQDFPDLMESALQQINRLLKGN